MIWYHISSSKDLKKIEKTISDGGEESLAPRIPSWIHDLKEDDPYKEPKEPPRICVAPSVWQCVPGLGKAYGDGKPIGMVYAYEIPINKVVKRTFDSPETVITDEHWIVDDVIEESIDIKILGCMQIENIFEEMKRFTIHKTLDQMKDLNEWECVWSQKDKINDLYELKLRAEDLQKILT